MFAVKVMSCGVCFA